MQTGYYLKLKQNKTMYRKAQEEWIYRFILIIASYDHFGVFVAISVIPLYINELILKTVRLFFTLVCWCNSHTCLRPIYFHNNQSDPKNQIIIVSIYIYIDIEMLLLIVILYCEYYESNNKGTSGFYLTH